MKIQHKLTATLIGASLVPMLFLGLIAYANSEVAMKKKMFTDLEAIAKLYTEKVQNYNARGGAEDALWNIVQDNVGLGKTGEIVIAKMTESGDAQFLAASRFDGDPTTLESLSAAETTIPIMRALSGQEGLFANLVDYRGIPVFAALQHIEDRGWGVSVQIDKSEVLAPLYTLRVTLIVMGCIVLAFSFLMAYLTATSIADPIQSLQESTEEIATGRLDSSVIQVDRDDEIGDLAIAFAGMTDELSSLYTGLEEKVEERTQQLNEALQDVKKFQLAVQSSTDAVMIAGDDQRILYVNPTWEALTGYSAREAIGQDQTVLHPVMGAKEEMPEALQELQQALASGQPYETEDVEYARKDGKKYNVAVSLFPVKEKGNSLVVEIHNDITSRKREERAKTEFVSLASHQLRTPLTAIRWAIGRLKRNLEKVGIEPENKKQLDAAHKGSINMAETIGTMLTISRLESGKIKLNPEPCDLVALLTDIGNLYQPQCEKEKKSLQISIPQGTSLQTDEKLLREVLSNLTSNAIKYSPEGSQALIRVQKDDKQVLIEVQDTGYGIPKEQQSQVFSIFFRAENVTSKPIEGTGLGLYLVYSLVTFLGGTIQFVSEENKGTTFSILLPITPVLDE